MAHEFNFFIIFFAAFFSKFVVPGGKFLEKNLLKQNIFKTDTTFLDNFYIRVHLTPV